MKKILLIVIALFGLSFATSAFAFECPSDAVCITVTENIPGADCELDESKPDDPWHRIYHCVVESGFTGFQKMIQGLVQWSAFIAILCGVLMLVVSGLQLSFAGIDASQKESAKKRIGQVLWGILILALIGVILNTVAPWVFQ